MGRSRKRQHRLPSIIDSDIDHRFSPSHISSDDSSDSPSDSSVSSVAASPPSTGKRSKAEKSRKKNTDKTQDPTAPTPPSKIDYILTAFTAAEMKKSASKREPKKSSLQLSADEPWDTLKAQLLVKINDLLKPSMLSINDYKILFTIPRVVAKPGYPLASATDYAILLERSSKSKFVQLSIVSTVIDNGNKENDGAENAEKLKKKKGGRRDPATLPGNVGKAANIRTLQERWKCAKKTPDCQGTYCFVNNEGTHLPLSHECLDCWAAAMVHFYSSHHSIY
jgi:hypothetical protein